MATKPETRLVNKIRERLWARYGSAVFIVKIHGSPFQRRGLPDLIVCFNGRFVGFEVKMPEKVETGVSDLQAQALREITQSGGFARVISTVEEAELVLNSLQERG